APRFDGGARGAGFIAQVVAIAHEGVNGAHGFALLRGEQHERIVEVLGAGAGHAPAVVVGLFDRAHHAARVEKATRATDASSSQTRSAFEMAGRARSTS